jgi:protein CpxP
MKTTENKISKKLIMVLISTVLLTTSLFASERYCKFENKQCENSKQCKYENKQCSKKMKNKGHHKKMGHHRGAKNIMKYFRQLNLTQEQKESLMKLKHTMKENKRKNSRVNMSEVFTSTEFNKEKFIQMRQNKIDMKANMIEKAYNILTGTQKEQLKTLISNK